MPVYPSVLVHHALLAHSLDGPVLPRPARDGNIRPRSILVPFCDRPMHTRRHNSTPKARRQIPSWWKGYTGLSLCFWRFVDYKPDCLRSCPDRIPSRREGMDRIGPSRTVSSCRAITKLSGPVKPGQVPRDQRLATSVKPRSPRVSYTGASTLSSNATGPPLRCVASASGRTQAHAGRLWSNLVHLLFFLIFGTRLSSSTALLSTHHCLTLLNKTYYQGRHTDNTVDSRPNRLIGIHQALDEHFCALAPYSGFGSIKWRD